MLVLMEMGKGKYDALYSSKEVDTETKPRCPRCGRKYKGDIKVQRENGQEWCRNCAKVVYPLKGRMRGY